jgi:flagellar basal-body rod protein FlgC
MSQLLSAVNAAASALDVQRARMEVAVSNMANAESTTGPNGEPYRRRDVVLETVPNDAFGQAMGAAGSNSDASGVRVAGVVEDQSPFKRRWDPSHPQADKDGFVLVPNVDVPEEMVNLLSAARAYQANLTAIGLIRDTVQKALELAK